MPEVGGINESLNTRIYIDTHILNCSNIYTSLFWEVRVCFWQLLSDPPQSAEVIQPPATHLPSCQALKEGNEGLRQKEMLDQ